jgi:hypothetical protein
LARRGRRPPHPGRSRAATGPAGTPDSSGCPRALAASGTAVPGTAASGTAVPGTSGTAVPGTAAPGTSGTAVPGTARGEALPP